MANPRVQGGGSDFTIVSNFKLGYRNREDITNLPPGVLIVGSKNVLTTTEERIASRRGYTLDGQANTAIAPILASYDWDMHIGEQRHLRAGFNTTGSNGKLQYRYVDEEGTVTWRDLMTGLTSVNINFTTFWDFDSEKKDFLLFVDGSSNVYEWSGGLATFASATATTITIEGTLSIPELNFYNLTPWGSVVIGGISYAYTGVSGQQFTGVTPNPTGGGHVAGDIIHQAVKTTPNSSITDLPDTFANALIGTLRNQVYIGSLTDRSVYISKQNNYKDFAFATPRVVGEGALVTLDDVPVAFIAQEDKMTFSAGKDQWYETKFTLSSTLAEESFEINRFKTTSRQGARSQAATTKIKNDIAFISFEPTLNTIGRLQNVVVTQQTENISNSIKNDFDIYDFDDCSTFYFREFIYVAVPQEGLVRIYNLINKFWEAPQTLPVSRFAIIDGELYGHSYQVGETYKLFTGYTDNENPINAKAVFSYNQYGSRTKKKGTNEVYSEGYMTQNTTLTRTQVYEIDGLERDYNFSILGSNNAVVANSTSNAPLGKVSLGKNPLGSSLTQSDIDALPNKFRWIQTFPEQYFYEEAVIFESLGLNQRWELLSFGDKILLAGDQNNSIKI